MPYRISVAEEPRYAAGTHMSTAGVLAWNYDIVAASGTFTLVNSALYVNRMPIPAPLTVNSVAVFVTTAGSDSGSGNLFASIHDLSGNLIAQSSNIAAQSGGTGLKLFPLPAPLVINPPQILVALWSNLSTTQVTLARSTGDARSNLGISGDASRFAVSLADTPTTTAPAVLGSRGSSNIGLWVGLK